MYILLYMYYYMYVQMYVLYCFQWVVLVHGAEQGRGYSRMEGNDGSY